MPKYQFEIDDEIDSCESCDLCLVGGKDCNQYSMCAITGEKSPEYFWAGVESMSDVRNANKELFKQCPLKLIEG